MRYDKAAWRPITVNFRRGRTRGTQRVMAFVCHSQEGYRSLHGLFNNPARRASTHFWVAKDGSIEQYLDTGDTAWGNGERNRSSGPDPRLPWLTAAYAAASVNDETVSCELEGRAGEAMTAAQEAAASELLRWVHTAHGLGPARRHLTVVEHNQLSATACPSNRWPIERLVAVVNGVSAPSSSAGVLAFWYPGIPYDHALARFVNETIKNDLAHQPPAGAARNASVLPANGHPDLASVSRPSSSDLSTVQTPPCRPSAEGGVRSAGRRGTSR